MSRIGRVVGMGLLTGLLFGAAMWYLNDDIWAGVIGGVAYGGVMAALMRNLWGSRAFKGLDRAQRKRVLRTMRRGEPMDDPELARPLVEQASAILAVPFSHMWLRIVFGLMFALGATGGNPGLGRRPHSWLEQRVPGVVRAGDDLRRGAGQRPAAGPDRTVQAGNRKPVGRTPHRLSPIRHRLTLALRC
ncbi:hypothetical protein [Kibdelosporangium aridum]|uniref:hypothetical protein n=1 Tax=Kibdelosporangium aridum TaxID=2030 RepID=UPI0035E7DEA2